MEAPAPQGNSRGGLEREVPARLVPTLKAAVQDFVHALVTGQYALLVAAGRAGHTNVEELEQAVTAYPYRILDLPEAAWPFADAMDLDSDPPSWHVMVDMWTAEEGRS